MRKKSLDLEIKLWTKYSLIVGVDEAGRGALAGPIVVAAVILPVNFQSPLIQDSKILTPEQRWKVYQLVKEVAIEYIVVFKDKETVEKKNPLAATKEAMKEAVLQLKNKPDLCLIDGKEKVEIAGIKKINIIGGDRKAINIAAASIVAKVTRDKYMEKLHEKYPQYDWLNNKGYANITHLNAIFQHGICQFHRHTYEPIKSLLKPDCNRQEIKKKYKL